MGALNDERRKIVTEKEKNGWKLGYQHGDYEMLADQHDVTAQTFSRAVESGKASDRIRAILNKHYNIVAEAQEDAA